MPAAGHRAVAKILYRSSAAKSFGPNGQLVNAPLTVDQVVQQVRLKKNIHRAVTTAFAPKSSGDAAASLMADDQVVALRDYLSAEGVPGETDGLYHITVSYVDQEADAAVQLVNAVADVFVEQCDRQDAAVRAELARRLDAARSQAEAARERLTAATEERDSLLAAPAQALPTEPFGREADSSVAVPAQDSSAPATADHDLAQPLNPDWVRLRDHIEQIESRRNALSATRTEAHPEMQGLTAELDQFAAILQRTPKYRDPALAGSGPDERSGGPAIEPMAPGPLPAPPGSFTDATQSDARTGFLPPATDAELPVPRDEVAFRVAALDTVIKLSQEHAAHGEQRVDQLRKQIQVASQSRAETEVRALTARPVGGALTVTRLLQLLGLSLAIGLVVAAIAPAIRANRVLRRAADAEQELGVPVIGAISSVQAVPPAAAVRPIRRVAVRSITTVAELALIAVAVLFLVTALTDRSLAATYLADPLHALSQTLDMARQRLVGG